jgi:hypothetical protein
MLICLYISSILLINPVSPTIILQQVAPMRHYDILVTARRVQWDQPPWFITARVAVCGSEIAIVVIQVAIVKVVPDVVVLLSLAASEHLVAIATSIADIISLRLVSLRDSFQHKLLPGPYSGSSTCCIPRTINADVLVAVTLKRHLFTGASGGKADVIH